MAMKTITVDELDHKQMAQDIWDQLTDSIVASIKAATHCRDAATVHGVIGPTLLYVVRTFAEEEVLDMQEFITALSNLAAADANTNEEIH